MPKRPTAKTLTNAPPMNGWRRVKFGDVVECVNDTVADPQAAGVERVVGLDHLDPGSLHIKRWASIEDGTTFTRRFKSGQVLFGKRRAYQRKLAVADFDGICSGDILVFEPKNDDIIPELLPFIMQAERFWQHALDTSAGSLSPRTKWQDLARYEFTLPPKEEHRRIADILWAADGSIQDYGRCEAAQESVRVSLARNYFDSGAEPSTKLGDVGVWMSGGTPERSNPDYWRGDIPWASPKDMKVDLLMDTEEHVTSEAVEHRSKLIDTGTILIVVRGMILTHTFPVAVAGKPMAFNQDMKALSVSGDFDHRYVFHWLRHMSHRILAIASESTHGTKRLPSEHLFGFGIPKPPIGQQKQIASALDRCDQSVGKIGAHVRRLEQLKKSVSKRLLEE